MSDNDDKILTDDQVIVLMHKAAKASPLYDLETVRCLCATSGMETRFKHLIADQTTKIVSGANCSVYPIGFEPASGIGPTALANPTVKSYLLKNELMGNAMPGGGMQWHPRLLTAAPLGRVIASFFEDVLRFEFRELVRYFSIGPTQWYLALTGPGLNATATNDGVKYFPKTFQELHDIYANSTRTQIYERIKKQYSWTPGYSDQARIDWLKALQTGAGIGVAEGYYHGTGVWSGTGGWKSKYNKVSTIITA